MSKTISTAVASEFLTHDRSSRLETLVALIVCVLLPVQRKPSLRKNVWTDESFSFTGPQDFLA